MSPSPASHLTIFSWNVELDGTTFPALGLDGDDFDRYLTAETKHNLAKDRFERAGARVVDGSATQYVCVWGAEASSLLQAQLQSTGIALVTIAGEPPPLSTPARPRRRTPTSFTALLAMVPATNLLFLLLFASIWAIDFSARSGIAWVFYDSPGPMPYSRADLLAQVLISASTCLAALIGATHAIVQPTWRSRWWALPFLLLAAMHVFGLLQRSPPADIGDCDPQHPELCDQAVWTPDLYQRNTAD